MFETVPHLPEHAFGVIAHGKITAEDYESVLIPKVEKRLQVHPKINLLMQLGDDFETFAVGAMWDDVKFGFHHLKAWHRVAIVTDIHWMIEGVTFFKFLVPAEVRIFEPADFRDAVTWVSEPID
jgi:hypothetical protein